ncbi:MAG: hypothetical protein LQ347_002622 [Umbilicaria vellea]|nr:MAG: hypothetical protein LQ347_002622 [Umbilicaria vellea]
MVEQGKHHREIFSFAIQSSPPSDSGPRCGTLSFPNRAPIATPHYLALSSRGAVPHMTQDTMRSSTSITGIYAALEDSGCAAGAWPAEGTPGSVSGFEHPYGNLDVHVCRVPQARERRLCGSGAEAAAGCGAGTGGRGVWSKTRGEASKQDGGQDAGVA